MDPETEARPEEWEGVRPARSLVSEAPLPRDMELLTVLERLR